jgi:hypothetical protein
MNAVERLQEQGFDQTTADGKYVRPRCSQCQVLVINGIACHETGCPNIVRDEDDTDEEDES